MRIEGDVIVYEPGDRREKKGVTTFAPRHEGYVPPSYASRADRSINPRLARWIALGVVGAAATGMVAWFLPNGSQREAALACQNPDNVHTYQINANSADVQAVGGVYVRPDTSTTRPAIRIMPPDADQFQAVRLERGSGRTWLGTCTEWARDTEFMAEVYFNRVD